VNQDVNSSGGTDPRLESLLELWDDLEEEAGQPNALGITVLVDGVTYSGLLVPGRVWSRSLATLLRSAPENHQVRTVSGYFDSVSESYQQSADPAEARRYLHLANVAVGLPNDGKRTSLFMRIRVSDVSAWTVGTIGELAPFTAPDAAPAGA
jgi:hypothetical protein